MTSLFRTMAGVLGSRLVARITRTQHQAPGTGPRKIGRRSFVRNAALGSVVLNTGLVTAFSIRMLWPNKTGDFGKVLRVPGSVIPEVGGEPFTNAAGQFYLVHTEAGVMALWWRCPHLGCTVPPYDMGAQEFHCPCHGSIYDYTGVRTGGPAPRPMDYMAVEIDNGDVLVDTGNIIERQDYQPSQAVPL
jgi:cytochrome b6-f complex iron-sulfur subunit